MCPKILNNKYKEIAIFIGNVIIFGAQKKKNPIFSASISTKLIFSPSPLAKELELDFNNFSINNALVSLIIFLFKIALFISV